MFTLFTNIKNALISALTLLLLSSIGVNYYLYHQNLNYKIATATAQAISKDRQAKMDTLQNKLKQEEKLAKARTQRILNTNVSNDCDGGYNFMRSQALNFKDNLN